MPISNLRNLVEDAVADLGMQDKLVADITSLLTNPDYVPSQDLLRFAGYTPSLFEEIPLRRAGVLANLARIVLL